VFWFRRRVPVHRASARGLVRDLTGRWLIVQPVGRRHWQLPGGKLERGESPTDACRREVAEEVGLELAPGPLLAVDWRPGRFRFVFDMGAHDAAGLRIELQRSELSAWRWVPGAEALSLLKPDAAALLTTHRAATGYREHR
jgi:8-oxo-dGTP diphosphatase